MNVYFLGIAGAGMSALASILVSEGHRVSGSDSGVFPPVTDVLDRLGVAWRDGFDGAAVPKHLDAAVIGGSAKLDLARNPELAVLKRRGVPLYSFPEFLGEHTGGRRNLVVAGSFGKSTLTALCAVLMREAGRDPGYFIGAAPLDLPGTGHAGSDPVFLIEGDEYITSTKDRRSKFIFYHPDGLLISSLIHDHLNAFPTFADYEKPFAALLAELPPEAPLVCADHPELRRLVGAREAVWYGLERGDWRAEALAIGEVTRFDLLGPGGERVPLETPLLGLHNVENIVGAAAFLLGQGEVDEASLQRGVARFRGVARRLDKKTTTSRVPVYEGFGSSYEKARSAIEAMLLHFPDRPLVVVFEPHTFSWRNREALAWYDRVFAGVAGVLLLPPPTHGETAHDQIGVEEILDRVRAAGVGIAPADNGGGVVSELTSRLKGDEVVLLLSSGPLDGLPASLPPALDAAFG